MNIKMVRGLAMVAILGVTGVTGIAVASAAPDPYNGKDPSLSRCQPDRKLVKTAQIQGKAHTIYTTSGHDISYPARNLGQVQLWYSPKCRTAWARVLSVQSPGQGGPVKASVIRKSDDKQYRCVNSQANFGNFCHTAMVNDANVMSLAHGEILYGGTWYKADTRQY